MMSNLDQLKRNQAHWTATAKAERRDSMAGFDAVVVAELLMAAPDRDGPPEWEEFDLSWDERYVLWDRGERAAYWAKERRRWVRRWVRRMAFLARKFARDLAAEGRVV